ncbi:MAG: DUF1330 domain-containing protein [Rubrivivax sp.]|nr:DUF1330 domain-containing protein [Rubrivivax sp.]
MAAYVIADIEVTDAALYDDYRKQVAATITAHGGRFLVRGGAAQLLEGERLPQRTVVLEFPDMAHLQTWYASPEYAPLIVLRQRASKGSLMSVEGAPPA